MKKLFFHWTNDNCGEVNGCEDRVINMRSVTDGEKAQGEQTHCVDGVNTFPALVPLPFHPVSVEISKEPVNIIGTRGVPIPFPSVVL